MTIRGTMAKAKRPSKSATTLLILFIFLAAAAAAIAFMPRPASAMEMDFCNDTAPCTDSSNFCACNSKDSAGCKAGFCVAERGNFCDSDADCASSTYCSREARLCVSRCFLFVYPLRATTMLEGGRVLKAAVYDPVGETRTYRLSIAESGEGAKGAPFASFLDGSHAMDVTVPKNGVADVPLEFEGSGIGKYTVKLTAFDVRFPRGGQEGINSDQCPIDAAKSEIIVESEITAFRFLSAPGLGLPEMCLVAILGGLAFAFYSRKGS